ncbi:ADP-ribosylglycohydrolase family protein [Bacillus massilinigeriensis]|uniref:ADP-ribosylglycohydrolase family protein n=1 Tax=Bacillus mediterraneensis TaxID=1805474 RepID=UPI0008F94DBF|nr:ADP-ribosylglycohydrolase family protein [Bacillus mediterraneensis]
MTGRRMIDRWEDDSKSFMALNIKKRVLSTIYGAIIGDALGVPVEFKPRDTFNISDMTGYGTHNQPPGTWSDDTSLTLCLMENLSNNGTMEDLMALFVQYRQEGYLTPFDVMFDIGATTDHSINRFIKGNPSQECGGDGEYDNGNGALMRIAPLTFMICRNFNFLEKAEVIKKYTEITHAHPRSIVGSLIYVEFLIRLYYNNSPSMAVNEIKALFDENFDAEHIYRTELQHYSRIFSEDFFQLPREKIKSGGYVVHTLEAAIWCLGTTNSFSEAVLKAVNLGEDTDTVASITGALAGMHYKLEDIPADWLEKLVRKQEIDLLIGDFIQTCANKAIIEEYGSL